MKEQFEEPMIQFIYFDDADIICSSSPKLPDDGF